MGDYRRLEVWQRARGLTRDVYGLTAGFPPSERYALTQQLRTAANSIGANLAEGIGRPSRKETAHFLGIAIGSANELEQHLFVAGDVGLAPQSVTQELTSEIARIRRMLVGLRKRFIQKST